MSGRTCEINSHQFYLRGYFHGWTRKEDGTLCAVVEDEQGNVGIYEMGGVYSLKFTDIPT